MKDELAALRDNIERYRRLLKSITDERVCGELQRLIDEAELKLREIEREE
jgi:predicted  nucleic acid-binding Zn-ribbon protein